MRTIIQKIGPLYGEVVNGSVFGQPNGSIQYQTNKIFVLTDDTGTYGFIKNNGAGVDTCKSDGTTGTAAILGTTVSFTGPYVFKFEVADSAAFTNILTTLNLASVPPYMGAQNNIPLSSVGVTSELTVVAGTTYYVRVKIVWEGNEIVTSDTFEFEGVV